MWKQWTGLFFALGAMLVISSPSRALDDDTLQTPMQRAVAALSDSRAQLTDEDGGDIADIEEYLYNALNMVYLAKMEANRTFDPSVVQSTNEDLKKLVELGYLPFWPDDPLQNWDPISLVAHGDDFTPCAILLVLCPPDYNTTINGVSSPLSFNIYINAPEMSFAGFSSYFSIIGENREWGTSVPEGALYGLSFCAQSDRKHEEIRERIKSQSKETTETDPDQK